MFLVLTCDSVYPAINRQDFDIWALSCRFADRPNVDEAKINLKRESSVVRNEMTKNLKLDITKNDMLRFQFLECVFNLAQLCFEGDIKTDSGKGESSIGSPTGTKSKKKKSGKIYLFQAINKLYKDYIEQNPNYQLADTQSFREELLYTYKVN